MDLRMSPSVATPTSLDSSSTMIATPRPEVSIFFITSLIDAVTEDGPSPITATGNLIANDSDADKNDKLSVTSSNTGTHGTLDLDSDGDYTYTLNNGSNAVQSLAVGQTLTDTFVYTLSDDSGTFNSTATALFTVTINGTNDTPSISGQTLSINENNTVGSAVATISASDVDTLDTRTFEIVGGTGQGMFAIHPTTGVLTAQAVFNHEDIDSFTLDISVTDNHNASPNPATFTININDVNDAPVLTVPGTPNVNQTPGDVEADEEEESNIATAGTFTITDEDDPAQIVTATLEVNITLGTLSVPKPGDAKDVTVGGSGTSKLTLTGSPSKVQATLNGTNGKVEFTGATDESGFKAEGLDVRVSDGGLLSEILKVDIDIVNVNDPPIGDVNGTGAENTDGDNIVAFTTQEDANLVIQAANGTGTGTVLAAPGNQDEINAGQTTTLLGILRICEHPLELHDSGRIGIDIESFGFALLVHRLALCAEDRKRHQTNRIDHGRGVDAFA